MIPLQDRQIAVELIDEAVSNGARRFKACEVLEIHLRTYFRWKRDTAGDKRKGAKKHIPRKLDKSTEQEIINICCSDKYKDKTPYDIYFSLLEDENRYIASIRTIYRVLKKAGKLHHRGRCKPRKSKTKPPEVIATGPNQVWCWDITWLSTAVKGIYLYAYMVIDIWDKSIVGWEVHKREDEKLAKDLFQRLQFEHNLKGIHLHSDNGHPMKGMSLLAFLYSMKVSVSRSRPRVSNDNPFIESYFKTMKYSICYPGHFNDLNHARSWMGDFVHWYNTEHRHSGIGFATPNQMRSGQYKALFEKRNRIIMEAYERNPGRWSHPPKLWNTNHIIYLNPSTKTRDATQERQKSA